MITKPKGTYDLYGESAKKWQYVNKVIDSLMEKYNYNFIRTPLFESSEVFHRGVGSGSDIVRKETYDFIDLGLSFFFLMSLAKGFSILFF